MDYLNIAKKCRLAAVMVFITLCMFFSPHVLAADKLLESVPADSLFCVRLNNLDGSLAVLDKYLMDINPQPAGVTIMARTGLSRLLSDPTLENVNTAASFALFALAKPADNAPADNTPAGRQSVPEPHVYFLVPMKDYDAFIRSNPNFTDTDTKGISKAGEKIMIKKVADYALVGVDADYDLFASAAALCTDPQSKKLAASLSAALQQRAQAVSLWAYADIKQVSKLYGTTICETLEKAKTEMPAEMGSFAGIFDIYQKAIKIALEQTGSVSLTVDFKPEVLKAAFNAATIPGTDLAQVFSSGTLAPAPCKLGGYLKDGAVMNAVLRTDAGWKKGYLKLIDMLMDILGTNAKKEDIDLLKQITSEQLQAMGDESVFCWDGSGNSIFSFIEAVAVKDEKAYAKAEEKATTAGINLIKPIYAETLGIDMNCTTQMAVETYRDVQINSFKMTIKSTKPDSEMGKMLDLIYKDGFDACWAVCNNTALTAMGDNNNAKIKQLIDYAKAGTTKPIPSEMQQAMKLLDNPDSAQIVGTLNVLRYLQVIFNVMKSEMPPFLSGIDAAGSTSGIAFLARDGNGALDIEIAIPKTHILEIKNAFEKAAAAAVPSAAQPAGQQDKDKSSAAPARIEPAAPKTSDTQPSAAPKTPQAKPAVPADTTAPAAPKASTTK